MPNWESLAMAMWVKVGCALEMSTANWNACSVPALALFLPANQYGSWKIEEEEEDEEEEEEEEGDGREGGT